MIIIMIDDGGGGPSSIDHEGRVESHVHVL